MKGWSLSRRIAMGSLDKWEVEPLLILLSIHVSLVSSSEKESKGAHHEAG